MAIATTFMATSFPIYVSKLLPKILVAVSEWRWLAIAGRSIFLEERTRWL